MSSWNSEEIPKKTVRQTLTDYTESLTDLYLKMTPADYRKKRGQYFTPIKVSEFMIKQFENINKKKRLRILDPAAGVGIFESTFCEYIKSSKNNDTRISFDLYESDSNLIPLLKHNMMACKKEMYRYGFDFSYKIFNKDFILSNASLFSIKNGLFANKKGYDLVIANPPYYKLKKNSPHVSKMKSIVDGPPNIYPLFMALSAALLVNGGQITVLTPRSYCSGLYFRRFRKWFFDIIKPYKIHLFESRKEVFKRYGVLQEIVILTAIKTKKIPRSVFISVSNGTPDENKKLRNRTTAYDRVIIKKDNDMLMRIPLSKLDELIADYIDKFEDNLESLGYRVSTGPVVPFRVKDLLLYHTYDCNNVVPLIWMHNIINGMTIWPVKDNDKATGIRKTDESKKILLPNKNYVLIKRFSTKEGKQRINAGIHLSNRFKSDFVGIENHVNYIHKRDGKLTVNEAYGIATLLNSRIYNRYFQMINGNTQINAVEINNLPFPSIETIKEIGQAIRNLRRENNDIVREQIIAKLLKVDKKIERGLNLTD